MALFGGDELDRYGKKFLCELFDKSQGIAERSFDRIKIFNALGLGGITGDDGIHRAADEIVQDLRRRELILTVNDSNNVRLTDTGLDEARKVCKG
jgi:hypothetical protein